MLTETKIEITDLPDFFKNIDACTKIQPVLYCMQGFSGRFRLVLEGGEKPLTVSKHSEPILFGSLRETLPILKEGFVRELLADEARIDLRGYL